MFSNQHKTILIYLSSFTKPTRWNERPKLSETSIYSLESLLIIRNSQHLDRSSCPHVRQKTGTKIHITTNLQSFFKPTSLQGYRLVAYSSWDLVYPVLLKNQHDQHFCWIPMLIAYIRVYDLCMFKDSDDITDDGDVHVGQQFSVQVR